MNIDKTEHEPISLWDSKILIVVSTYLIGKEKSFGYCESIKIIQGEESLVILMKFNLMTS
ncbi:42636_t:CDS:2 [Gigaspora margarita]|uniref:42636_t:CDS:1 n=1 Tax=Gigaspora margarita TaxID=4874 RepID=A0ABN7UA65_GIGMA|nr:42636_t:CDS:2 [Gigaspora margarita]